MPDVIVERVGSETIAAIGKFLYNFTTALVFRSRGFNLNRTVLLEFYEKRNKAIATPMESQLKMKIVQQVRIHLFVNVMRDGVVTVVIDPGLFPICS